MTNWEIEEIYCPPQKCGDISINEFLTIDVIDSETGKNAGCAELSPTSMKFFIKGNPIKNPQWFFNRLFVKPEFRGRGGATALLEHLKKVVHERGFCLYCGVNPYGDLNRSQLNALYKKHGFQRKRVTCDTDNFLFYGLFMNYKL